MIIICALCGSENNVPDLHEQSKRYRCGKCNFLLWQKPDSSNVECWTKYKKNGEFDGNQWQNDQNKEFQMRAKFYLEDLKKLSDEELMAFDITLHEQSLEEAKHNYLSYRGADPALYAAIYREVDRRNVAAGWFWRRWRKPLNYKKWVEHCKRTEEMSLQWAQETISRTHPGITLERK
jgi:hypothetical protein